MKRAGFITVVLLACFVFIFMQIPDVSAEPPGGKGKNKLTETIAVPQTGQTIS